MSATLRAQRLGALEATTLLRKVMEEIDVAVFAFDGEHRLRLVNRAGERLLKQPAERILTAGRANLGLAEFLDGEANANRPAHLSGRRRPLGHDAFDVPRRRPAAPAPGGQRSDARAARRGTERPGRRLVRVLGHELNNSLAPIKSIAGSLETLVARDPLPDDWRDDTRRGLVDHRLAQRRAEPLSGSLRACSRNCRRLGSLRWRSATWIRQSATLETASDSRRCGPGPEMTIQGDRDPARAGDHQPAAERRGRIA